MGNILNKVPDKNATSLMGFIDEDYVEETPFGWDDMPEFDQPEKGQFHLMRVRFDCEEDLREFAKKIDQENITTKTKAIWYPAREKKEANVLKWVEDGSV